MAKQANNDKQIANTVDPTQGSIGTIPADEIAAIVDAQAAKVAPIPEAGGIVGNNVNFVLIDEAGGIAGPAGDPTPDQADPAIAAAVEAQEAQAMAPLPAHMKEPISEAELAAGAAAEGLIEELPGGTVRTTETIYTDRTYHPEADVEIVFNTEDVDLGNGTILTNVLDAKAE